MRLCRGLLFVVRPSVVPCPSVYIFSCFRHQNRKSDWAETWWEALGLHANSEMLKSLRSDIEDGHHGDHLQSLHICSRTLSRIENKLGRRHLGHISFRMAQIIPLRYPRWPQLLSFWNCTNVIFRALSRFKLKLEGRHREDMEIQVSYNRFVPISKMAATVPILKIFKRHLLQKSKSD